MKTELPALKNNQNFPLFPDFAPKCFKKPFFLDFLPQNCRKTQKTQCPIVFPSKNNGTVPKNLLKPLPNNPKTQIRKKMREMSRFLP